MQSVNALYRCQKLTLRVFKMDMYPHFQTRVKIVNFFVLFAVVIFGFSIACLQLYGNHLPEFSYISGTMTFILQFAMGYSDTEQLLVHHSFLTILVSLARFGFGFASFANAVDTRSHGHLISQLIIGFVTMVKFVLMSMFFSVFFETYRSHVIEFRANKKDVKHSFGFGDRIKIYLA